MRNLLSACLLLTLAMYSQAQLGSEMQFIFQELGVELPPMPPKMPQSLREHLYPQRQQQQRRRQQQQQQLQLRLRLQRQRQLAALRAAQTQSPPNPYSMSYRQSRTDPQTKQVNSVYSAANRIRSPRPTQATNTATVKANPYGAMPGSKANPYSQSRFSSPRTPLPTVPPTISAPMILSTIQRARSQRKKIKEAKLAGCKMPIEGPASMALGTCKRSSHVQLMCQSMMLWCQDIGVVTMCCPYGNQLTRDTMSYMQKLRTYVSEVA